VGKRGSKEKRGRGKIRGGGRERELRAAQARKRKGGLGGGGGEGGREGGREGELRAAHEFDQPGVNSSSNISLQLSTLGKAFPTVMQRDSPSDSRGDGN
jgi:hypothetical protein